MKFSLPTVSLALAAMLLLNGCAAVPSGDAPSAESATRTVQTVFGDKEVPVDPQRIVIVRTNALDTALALGIEPVGTTYWGGGSGLPGYLAAEAPKDMALIGTDDEPDFEAIAALKPDLIIGDESIENNLETFESIAPVAAYDSLNAEGRSDWREHLAAIAGFTGREDKANTVIASFDEMVADLDADIANKGQTVIPLRVRADQVRHYLPESLVSAGVLQGLRSIKLPGPIVASENDEWSVIPAEQLSVLDADTIIAFIDSTEAYESLQQQSLWRALPAVQNDKVCVSENQAAWILAGPSAAKIVAQDVRECLATS
ncbi:iron-siderophore ABC transporter substrate-binding protein [Leucobacter sp. wl10]|uniref:ABC transporter substrate-binding protein n=1 Tax=Leucobacter sp. wl10 TaxID=2304677 RepID=UPI000E5AFDDB|nr:iron-siderophore ABC transporter substrate-binding protein [Leucobacter sp. wl10]RGE19776.1 iron-siderophore ABC transporter substrate-binding protein [Leucobacter sp. wl10]